MIDKKHIPVLLSDAIEYLNPKKGDTIVDATFGLGGHSKEILKKIGTQGRLIAFEKDKRTYKEAAANFKKYSNVFLFNSGYETIEQILKKLDIKFINGILFDLGVSSLQFDEPERGFSFRFNGPLDMRFTLTQQKDAAFIVNEYTEKELKEIIYKYGEEVFAGRISRAICRYRKDKSIKTTLELRNIIEKALPKKKRWTIYPATKTFQALRIEVNKELDVLSIGLNKVLPKLQKGARIVVISFHSLEDRIVKEFFALESKACICPKQILVCKCGHKAGLKVITRKPVAPLKEEIEKNPRSRSAKLRAAERI
ncbi:16S rRNA (cytosine(1402)-N(4))-methyltransferase RsmH [bacterium]